MSVLYTENRFGGKAIASEDPGTPVLAAYISPYYLIKVESNVVCHTGRLATMYEWYLRSSTGKCAER